MYLANNILNSSLKIAQFKKWKNDTFLEAIIYVINEMAATKYLRVQRRKSKASLQCFNKF